MMAVCDLPRAHSDSESGLRAYRLSFAWSPDGSCTYHRSTAGQPLTRVVREAYVPWGLKLETLSWP